MAAKISVNFPDRMVVVDGVGRRCNIDALVSQMPGIRAIHFDSWGDTRIEKEPGNGDNRSLKGDEAKELIKPFAEAWEAAANDTAKPAPANPDAVHIAYIKLALAEAGKLEAVDKAVEKTGGPAAILWDYASTLRETDQEVVAIGAALGLDVGAIFRRAREIRVAREG